MAGFKVASEYVKSPGNSYGKGPSGLQPSKARTRSYSPELATNNGVSKGSAPKHNKQPTEA